MTCRADLSSAWATRPHTPQQHTREERGEPCGSPHVRADSFGRSETEDRHDCGGLIEAAAAHPDAAAGNDRDILLASDAVGHRRSGDRRAEAEAPRLLERLGIISGEFAGHMPGEQQVTV